MGCSKHDSAGAWGGRLHFCRFSGIPRPMQGYPVTVGIAYVVQGYSGRVTCDRQERPPNGL